MRKICQECEGHELPDERNLSLARVEALLHLGFLAFPPEQQAQGLPQHSSLSQYCGAPLSWLSFSWQGLPLAPGFPVCFSHWKEWKPFQESEAHALAAKVL